MLPFQHLCLTLIAHVLSYHDAFQKNDFLFVVALLLQLFFFNFHTLNRNSQEAEEKSNEIRAKAKEEADIEKQKLVMTDKKKIQNEYDRKQKQVIMQQRM